MLCLFLLSGMVYLTIKSNHMCKQSHTYIQAHAPWTSASNSHMVKLQEADNAASVALGRINQSDIDILQINRGLFPRSVGLRIVLEAVMVLLNEETDRANIQRVVGGPSFLKRLEQFDKYRITLQQVQTLKQKYVGDIDDLHVEIMLWSESVCKVANALCEWVHALISIAEIRRESDMLAKVAKSNINNMLKRPRNMSKSKTLTTAR